MNVCFKRIKEIAEVSLSEYSRKWEIWSAFSVTFVCVNFTAIDEKCLNKNLFLKISQYSPENTCVVRIFFYKLKAFSFQDSTTGVFLWAIRKTPILKNVCEPLTFAFFKLIPRSSWKKTHSKDKVTETR